MERIRKRDKLLIVNCEIRNNHDKFDLSNFVSKRRIEIKLVKEFFHIWTKVYNVHICEFMHFLIIEATNSKKSKLLVRRFECYKRKNTTYWFSKESLEILIKESLIEYLSNKAPYQTILNLKTLSINI